jgi:AcrR family transcriptional regulator
LACGHANANSMSAWSTSTPVTIATAFRVGERVGIGSPSKRTFIRYTSSACSALAAIVKNECSFYDQDMPRVSEAHRERRRQQILEAARRCFIRKGFHQSSMADVFAEADLSAGAVYRYFRSKDEIIAAIAEEVIGHITDLLVPMVDQDPPPALDSVLRDGLGAVDELAFGEYGFAQLAPQVWAEALRNPMLLEVIRARYTVVRATLSRLVVAEQKVGRVAADADADEVAAVLFGSIIGYLLQRLLFGELRPETYAAGLAGLAR